MLIVQVHDGKVPRDSAGAQLCFVLFTTLTLWQRDHPSRASRVAVERAAADKQLVWLTAGENEVRGWSVWHLWRSSNPEDQGEHCVISRNILAGLLCC
jgi:hypothetical protein